MPEVFDLSRKKDYPLRFIFAAYKVNKDSELMNEIYRRTYKMVFAKTLSLLFSSDQAAIKVQEVYRRMALTLDRFEVESDIEKYLHRLIYKSIEMKPIRFQLKQA